MAGTLTEDEHVERFVTKRREFGLESIEKVGKVPALQTHSVENMSERKRPVNLSGGIARGISRPQPPYVTTTSFISPYVERVWHT